MMLGNDFGYRPKMKLAAIPPFEKTPSYAFTQTQNRLSPRLIPHTSFLDSAAIRAKMYSL
jgi:hypothetical protein